LRGGGTCAVCGTKERNVAPALAVCADCIRDRPAQAEAHIHRARTRSRVQLGLPAQPPRDPTGPVCRLCVNECRPGPGQLGYCGLRVNRDGKLVHLAGTAREGVVSWYYDPLPTNCVADWVCAGGTGAGYPKFAHRRGPEYGWYNLAVFLGACSYDCLFCQNRSFQQMAVRAAPRAGARDLAAAVRPDTACICYFGGDPTPQLPYTIAVSEMVRAAHPQRILRICWETNGSMHPGLLERIARTAVETGGCVKFDLKAWDRHLHLALTGVSNERTLANFERAAAHIPRRPDPPPLVAGTLLVPGYVDRREVAALARFIAQLDPNLPYTLLAFHPCHLMRDLPTTARLQAEDCRQAALDAGLTRVRLGNVPLLS